LHSASNFSQTEEHSKSHHDGTCARTPRLSAAELHTLESGVVGWGEGYTDSLHMTYSP
jgi:hypothetical protein